MSAMSAHKNERKKVVFRPRRTMARSNQQMLDEQAAGLIAEKMESVHGGRA